MALGPKEKGTEKLLNVLSWKNLVASHFALPANQHH